MDMISAALGLEYGSDEEMRALAEKLRKEKRAADVFSLSPTFEKQAAAQQQNIMQSAEKAGLQRAKELDRQMQEKLANQSDAARLLAAQIGNATKPSDINSLQDQIEKIVGKDFRGRTRAIRDIASYAQGKTGFSDHALIFRYMKFLDPTSTVREGEFATVEQTASLPDRVVVLFNKTLQGHKLTDEQRQEIVGAVTNAYPGMVSEYEETLQPFLLRADDMQVPHSRLSIAEPFEIPEGLVIGQPTGTSKLPPPPDGFEYEYDEEGYVKTGPNGEPLAVKINR